MPSVYGLIADFGDRYSHALEPVDPMTAEPLVMNGNVFVIMIDGYTVGAFAFTDAYDSLHATVHLLVRPWALKAVLHSPAIAEMITALFLSLKLVKLKGKCLAQQFGARRLLKSYGFRNQGYLKNETIHKGNLADMELYELSKEYWFNKWVVKHELWR